MSTKKAKTKSKSAAGGASPGAASKSRKKTEFALSLPNPQDVEETLLREKLRMMDQEISDHKKKIQDLKKENEWYRQEIENSRKDASEYIRYLENRKREKEDIVANVSELGRKELERLIMGRKDVEEQHRKKIDELRATINDLDFKLEATHQELSQLAEIKNKRIQHDLDIKMLQAELDDMEVKHKETLSEMERGFIESRINLQRATDAKIHEMSTMANEKASTYLDNFAKTLEDENARLREELRQCLAQSAEQMRLKDMLEQQNRELHREAELRRDMLLIRINRIKNPPSSLHTTTKYSPRHHLSSWIEPTTTTNETSALHNASEKLNSTAPVNTITPTNDKNSNFSNSVSALKNQKDKNHKLNPAEALQMALPRMRGDLNNSDSPSPRTSKNTIDSSLSPSVGKTPSQLPELRLSPSPLSPNIKVLSNQKLNESIVSFGIGDHNDDDDDEDL